ncbi:response regulator transcription factor [Lacrimispora xylanolytica]|uniref:Stage 0 sporulation protein A homolog n=1 Tax=Lacrimispora xylanolytica TaxID=29375 RepID=A0ABY7AC59_9FIRM|nr:response regulator transcription factor [Lacrimispora xylanolytica]WAJ23935.1 response regulator transcription factor [Lacrimispora xylanolytica]
MEKKKIYLADDEQPIRDLIQLFLAAEDYEVQTFPDGDKLLSAFDKSPSDMVILDIMMPGTDGLVLCSEIRKRSNTLIIIVSARDSETDRIAGITLGSDDYLTKPFSPMELVTRVKALFRRMDLDRGSYRGEIYTYGNIKVDVNKREFSVDEKPLDITPTEFALMVYLLERKDQAVSREDLLKYVWKFDFEADTRATDDVIKRLRKKLVTAEANAKIQSVWGYGFRLELGDTHEEYKK